MNHTPEMSLGETISLHDAVKNSSANATRTADCVNTLELDNAAPGKLDRPAFLMNCPFSYSTDLPNNIWMQEIDDNERRVNRNKAMSQFSRLYNHIASDGIVFLLPAPSG
jgi:hypothetical protein